ncbi:nitroreductase [Thalassorhabdus alkalitolerans]|uniref:Putative NAD(P)H nitroreductase n=1 Tax=Thalassorhabdus alkalitolerans TaxID=2282697 RepID=A0ABW0YPK6_9BACI
MDVLKAIETRRSNGLVSDKPVPEELLEKVLEAGTWAPNHHRTEPWRYFVLTGTAREPLGEVLAEITAKEMEDPESETNKKKLERVKANPFRAPVIIAVGVEPSEKSRVMAKEEHAAVYASIQNMLLAAHSLGLGVFWRTGEACYNTRINELFGLSEKGEMLAFLYLGYPKKEMPAGKRKHYSEVTTWIKDKGFFHKA